METTVIIWIFLFALVMLAWQPFYILLIVPARWLAVKVWRFLRAAGELLLTFAEAMYQFFRTWLTTSQAERPETVPSAFEGSFLGEVPGMLKQEER